MSDKETEDGAIGRPQEAAGLKQHGLFGSAGIQLTDDELSSPATTKFLRHLNSNQESEIGKLRSYENQYYDKRQECEVIKKEKEILENELASKKEMENLQKVMISLGSIMLGSLKFLEGQALYLIIIISLISVILIIGGMFPVLRLGASK
jgi:hypothetical protein